MASDPPSGRTGDPVFARLLEGLFEHSLEGAFLVQTDGTVLRANPAACRAFGRTEQELQLLGRGGLVVPDEALAALLGARARDGVAAGELTYRRPDGSTFPAAVTSGLIDDGAGGPAAYVLFRDLTPQRRAEAELQRRLVEGQEREAWLQASQRVARLGHYIYDLAADRWTSSAVLDEIFGIDGSWPRTAAGWLGLVHEQDREAMTGYLGALLAGGGRFDREYRLRAVPGQPERWVHGLGDLALDERGRPLRLFGTIQDVTARHEAARAREELAGQLRQAQKLESIGRLAGGVAHDFNNILVVFLACAGSLRERLAAGEPPALEDVDELEEAARRARDLTAQLLAFARKQVIAPVPLDLNEVVRRAERLLRRVLGEDVELRLQLEPGLWTVCCDPGQLEQVLVNLAVNARDAMPRGGRLTISTRNQPASGQAQLEAAAAGERVTLLVEDTGTGMSPQTQARLFEPFFTTKPPGKGTGLGLATVYGIVAQAGGTIVVRSAPGQGSAFEIALPSSRWAAAAGAAPARPAPGKAGSGRILLVEDDDLVREVAARTLRAAGYEVLAATGGVEALALAGDSAPRLLLTDVVMPGMDGQQLAAALRQRDPGLRVLFMSGHARDVVAQHGVADPPGELLEKPFSSAVLLDRVRALLEAAGG